MGSWRIFGSFQAEWRIFYQEPWIPPHESPDAQYRASKLKAYLYYRTLDRLCAQMKEYAEVHYGRAIRFYVPTHSLINYTQWRIVSPEALLVNMPACDGFIAQVWTGTSRTRNVYKGIREERTFETAFLEYGVMQELVRGTGRDMWFLHDPIEDNPNYTWSDYKVNYEDTVVASLLHPYVNNYEICPWPRRVFEVAYPKEDGKGKEMIPPDYATELLTVMHVLRDMHRHEEIMSDEQTDGIGLLLANSAMFQRGDIELDSNEADFRYDGTISSLILPSERHEEDIVCNRSHKLCIIGAGIFCQEVIRMRLQLRKYNRSVIVTWIFSYLSVLSVPKRQVGLFRGPALLYFFLLVKSSESSKLKSLTFNIEN
ncbi:hypothetical protein AB4Z22_08520 [Paenibacillus sp. TAF58]